MEYKVDLYNTDLHKLFTLLNWFNFTPKFDILLHTAFYKVADESMKYYLCPQVENVN